MGKISLKSKIISIEEKLYIETTGIKTNNKIVYKENDKKVTILIFDNKIEMNRYSNDYEINLLFEKNKKTISHYNIFFVNKIYNLKKNIKKIRINNKKI